MSMPRLAYSFGTDITEVVGLLVIDRILIACRAARPHGNDAAVVRVLDVGRRRPRDIGADLIELAGDHGMNRVVVVDSDGHAGERVEPEHRDRLVGRPLAVRSLPPPTGLRIDDLAVDVDVRLSRSISHSRGRQPLPRHANRFDNLLLVVLTALSARTVRVRRGQQHVRRGNSQLLLDSSRHRLPERRRYRSGIHRDERCAGRAALENNRTGVQAIEDAATVLRELTLGRCDIHPRSADAQCGCACRLSRCHRRRRGHQQQRREYPHPRVRAVSHSSLCR